MQIMISAELVSAIFVLISILGQFSEGGKEKSSQALKLCSAIILVWLLVDAAAYLLNGPAYPMGFLWLINLLAYSLGGICFLTYIRYYYISINEKATLKLWTVMIPAVVTIVNEIITVALFVSGRIVIFDNGYVVEIGGIPVICQLVNIGMLVYLPLLALTKHKQIGVKAVSYLGLYGIAPLIAIVIVLYTGHDFTVVLGATSIVIVASLLQKDEAQNHIRKINRELERSNMELQRIAEEQEAQLEEIKSLNQSYEVARAELEEELQHVEEARAEAMLNNEIISSISKLYFAIFRIDLINDFYEEVASDNEVHRLTGHEGPAYQKMMELCDTFVTAEYDKEIREFFNLNTVAERLAEEETITAEYLATDGNWHQARFISKRRDENGVTTHVLYVTRLVSQEKIKELEAGRMLQVANNAKTSFLFNMSHDIRTPMNAIIGYCDLMQRYFDDKERCRNYLKKVRSSSDFLLSLINNVLEMARIESGKSVLDESPCNTLDVFINLNSVYEELMRNKGITYTSSNNVQTPFIYCDKVKVNEIFLNLLSNAYKYTPEGGRVSLDIKELPSEEDGKILIETTVSDTGIGMSKDYIPYLFDEFSREYSSTDNKVQGTGLGMPIVKRLVELMQGTITVESELGKGTSFVVTLPHRVASISCVDEKSIEKTDAEVFKGMRILLAEDNDFNAEIATEILTDVGFIVDRAEDGIVCVNMLSKSPHGYYDFILMDIQMPNMDGYKATRAIRGMENEYRNSIPIIAMTANAFENDKKDAIDAGMDGHIAKPIKAKKVMDTISEVLQKKSRISLAGGPRKSGLPLIPHVQRIFSEMDSSNPIASMPGGVFAYLAEEPETLIFANALACKIWGCASFEELKEYTGGSFKGMVHPDDYERIEGEIWQQIKDGNDNLDCVDYRAISKDGSVRYIKDYGKLIRDEENADIFYVFVADVTEAGR